MRMPARITICSTVLLCVSAFAALPSWADDAMDAPEGGNETLSKSLKIDADAPKAMRWDVYMAGYAHHDRNTYTDAQLRKMNETTWGGGLGKTYRNESGNDESVYLIGIRDSNRHAQWMAGYSHIWMLPLKTRNKLEVGAGLTALVVRRQDWYDGRPFPALLPVATIGNRAAQLVATYVPHLSARNKKGNILSVMLRIAM